MKKPGLKKFRDVYAIFQIDLSGTHAVIQSNSVEGGCYG
jgi:hypothetical protein